MEKKKETTETFGYWREDLNLIVYQNMLNLHKWHKSGERNFLQIGREYMLNYSLACSVSKNLSSFKSSTLNYRTKLNQTWQRWSPFKIVYDSPVLHSRWWSLLKVEISLIVYCCFIWSQNELKFLLTLHASE
jgi:hypothetical protein